MPKKISRTSPQDYVLISLSPDALRAGISQMEKRIQDLQALDPRSVSSFDDPRFEGVEKKVNHTIGKIFGTESREFADYSVMLNTAPVSVMGATPISEIRRGYEAGVIEAIEKLTTLIGMMQEELTEKAGLSEADQQSFAETQRAKGRNVFLVHGHDEAAKQEVARFLERLKLNPIILHEQADRGQTIIEKFERHAREADFAVILLTPDDVGHRSGFPAEARPRARQNVILELGFFVGALGRQCVVPLVKPDVERPSDYDGVLYKPMDAGGGWKLELAKEIVTSGIEVDLNLAM